MTSNLLGLTDDEVRQRKANGLSNVLTQKTEKTVTEIIIENSVTVFNFVNLSIISFLFYYYLQTNDTRLLWDGSGLVLVTFFNTAIAVFQGIRSARTLEKMELLKNHPVTVLRNGKEEKIQKEEIVQGDVVVVTKGEQIVVDGRVLESNHLEVDESLLTGESIPLDKDVGHHLLSGSYCVYGKGYMSADQVGDASYASQIMHLSKKYKFLASPLLKKINIIFVASFIITILFIAIEAYFDLSNGNLTVENIRKMSTIAISLIPEGLVFFSSVTFLLGIFRISKLGAIVQKINAVDAFSTVNVVCMDKTGTLTKNNIAVAKICSIDSTLNNDSIEKLLGTFSQHSTEQNATIKALTKYDFVRDSEWIDEIPFRSDLKMSFLKLKIDESIHTYVLGAYETVKNKVENNFQNTIEHLYKEKKLSGLRNLIFGRVNCEACEGLTKDDIAQYQIEPIAIVAMKDEVREDAKEGLELFRKNNIDVKIISGDSLDSVKATIKELELDISPDEYVTGDRLQNATKEDYARLVNEKKVFARVKPDHKLELVKALKKQHKSTAFIGDGVNDLPAIKEADLGIAMEEGATITKEAADIVLLNNKFEILPAIFDEGNKVINTVNFVARLFLSKNVFFMMLSILAWFSLVAFPLTPRNTSLLNLLGVGLPAYFIALVNKNTKPRKTFFRDIFVFILFTSPAIFGFIYLANYFGNNVLELDKGNLYPFLTVIIITLFITNYYCTVAFEDSKNRSKYAAYGIGLIMVYAFFLIVPITIPVLNLVQKFYEITTIPNNILPVIGGIYIVGSLILAILHYVRSRYFVSYRRMH